jgi:hypothetical protein
MSGLTFNPSLEASDDFVLAFYDQCKSGENNFDDPEMTDNALMHTYQDLYRWTLRRYQRSTPLRQKALHESLTPAEDAEIAQTQLVYDRVTELIRDIETELARRDMAWRIDDPRFGERRSHEAGR